MGRDYTARGQLETVSFGGNVVDTRTYDNGGRMVNSAYDNGITEIRDYNIDNTLQKICFQGAAIGNLTYGWDNRAYAAQAIRWSAAPSGGRGNKTACPVLLFVHYNETGRAPLAKEVATAIESSVKHLNRSASTN